MHGFIRENDAESNIGNVSRASKQNPVRARPIVHLWSSRDTQIVCLIKLLMGLLEEPSMGFLDASGFNHRPV